jgi:uncharacterized membrane protein
MTAEAAPERGLSPKRVEGLADGVFAIVMTLLVIDIHAPIASSSAELAATLVSQWPEFLSYAISFIVLGVMWFGHRMEFHYITRMDRQGVLTSLLFMATVTFLPFSSSLMERNIEQPLAVAIFGMNVFFATTLRWWHWHHVSTTGHWFFRASTPPRMIRSIRIRAMIVPLLYLVASALTWLSIPVAIVLFVAIPVVYVVPASMDPSLNP